MSLIYGETPHTTCFKKSLDKIKRIKEIVDRNKEFTYPISCILTTEIELKEKVRFWYETCER